MTKAAPALWPSRGGIAEKWIETALIHGEGDLYGKPFRLLEEQRLFLWEWYEYDPNTGDWRYRQALKGDPRGAGKTEFLAAIACLEFAGPSAFRRLTPIIHVAAASLGNAGELFGQIQIMLGGQGDSVAEAPLCGRFNVYDTRIEYRDGSPGYIQRIAADAGTNQGGKTTLFLADEIHEWTGRRERVHSVISSALAKRRGAREINITTAGPRRGDLPPKPTDGIAWTLYAKGLDKRHDPTAHPRFLFHWREPSRTVDLEDREQRRAAVLEASGSAAGRLWDLEDRLDKWDDPEFRHSDFERYFLNRWPEAGAGSWLEELPNGWRDLEVEGLELERGLGLDLGTHVTIGVDSALRHDTASVTVIADLEELGRRAWASRVFEAERGRIDQIALREHLRALAARYVVDALAYDPRFFELPAQILDDEGWPVVEVPQSPERMGRAEELVYRQIVGLELVTDGDPVLTAHVEAAVWRESDRGRVLSKSKSGGPIDALKAGVMATYVRDLADLEAENEPPDLARSVW